MTKTLFTLPILFFISSCIQIKRLPTNHPSIPLSLGLPLMNANAPFTGQVPINQSPPIFVVSADLVDELNPYPNPPNSTYFNTNYTVNMMLGLYTSDTLLFDDQCLGFVIYDCEQYSFCHKNPYPTTNTYPYFEAQAISTATFLYLDYNHWGLYNYAQLITSCTTSMPSTYGQGTYGLLGLGFNKTSAGDFTNPPLFSIYFPQNSSNGELIFYFNNSLVESNNPVATLYTDTNWNVIVTTTLELGFSLASSINVAGSMFFDLNANAIGVPYSVYTKLVSSFAQAASTSCSNALAFPVCSFSKNISSLPNLTITVNQQEIVLPPQIYLEQKSGSVTLNLRAIGANLTGYSYVTQDYENDLILDYHVLMYFYTTFDGASSAITLYTPRYSFESPVDPIVTPIKPHSYGVIIGVSVGSFVILVIIACLCIRWCMKKNRVSQPDPFGERLVPQQLLASQ